MIRGAVCGSPARTDLWEPGAGDRLGRPGDSTALSPLLNQTVAELGLEKHSDKTQHLSRGEGLRLPRLLAEPAGAGGGEADTGTVRRACCGPAPGARAQREGSSRRARGVHSALAGLGGRRAASTRRGGQPDRRSADEAGRGPVSLRAAPPLPAPHGSPGRRDST
jgi:hypothetical protein